jgi:hypothetical protein
MGDVSSQVNMASTGGNWTEMIEIEVHDGGTVSGQGGWTSEIDSPDAADAHNQKAPETIKDSGHADTGHQDSHGSGHDDKIEW